MGRSFWAIECHPAAGLAEGEHPFLVLERGQTGHIVLPVDENDGGGGAQQLQSASAGCSIELLAMDAQQIPLQQTIGEQQEGHLIDDEIERKRGEVLQVGETFQLPVPFFNGRAKQVVLTAAGRILEGTPFFETGCR